MKTLLKLLIRLYPASWRERYGEEMDALLDDARPRWTDLADLTRSALAMQLRQANAAKLALGFMGLGALLPAVYLFVQPVTYESSVEFALAWDAEYTRGRIQQVLRRSALVPLMNRYSLFPEGTMEDRVERFRRQIRFIARKRGSLDLAFTHSNARTARAVTNDLADALRRQGLFVAAPAGPVERRKLFYARYAFRGFLAGLLLWLGFLLMRRLVPAR